VKYRGPTVAEWNRDHPIGTRVLFQPVKGIDKFEETRTRSEAWEICGTPVVMIDGRSGGCALDHMTVMTLVSKDVDISPAEWYSRLALLARGETWPAPGPDRDVVQRCIRLALDRKLPTGASEHSPRTSRRARSDSAAGSCRPLKRSLQTNHCRRFRKWKHR
jgi:hypothetical protein